MFSRIHFIIFTLILIIFGYLFFLNPDEVEFTVYHGNTLSISPALIAFSAFIIGAFFVFLVTLFVDTKRAFDLWRSSKQQKKEEEIQDRYSEALEYMMKGDLLQAQDILAKNLAKNPHHLPSYISLANLHFLEGKHAQAIEILIRAKVVDPENLELLFDLAKNYLAVKDYDLTIEALNHILDRDLSNREALRKKRDTYILQGNWPAAYQTQKNIVKYTREKEFASTEKKTMLGLEYKFGEELAQKGSFKEAEKTLREITKEDRDFLPAHVALGDVLQRQGEFDEAGHVWQKALESTWNPVFLERLESLYLSTANPKKVLQLYHEYMMKRPEDNLLRFFFSRLLIRLEMIDEALEQLREMELAGSSFPELYVLMGQAYHRRGDSAQANEAYEKALDAKKFSPPSYKCSQCGEEQAEWAGFCETCHSWGTFSIKLPEISQVMPVIPFYSFPYQA